MTILLVDADQTFQDSVANLLIAGGVEKFEMALSKEEAANKISGSKYDIILIDLYMPDLNVLHFAQECRNRMPEVKIILLLEDDRQPDFNGGDLKLNLPTVLKAFASRYLLQLISLIRSQSRILLAENLCKTFGNRVALRGLSFSMQAGRVLGLLGPNGAGKTTAIRILTTILEPTSGNFFIDGIDSDHPERIRRKIGVLPESLGFPNHLTGIECLTFFGQLYGRSAREARAYGMVLLKEVGLHKRERSLIGTYSRGMRQRLGIARALINDPVVVFLDEPTLGLDPRGQQELLALVRRIARERNAGVVLCSHFLSEIEAVCDEVVILKSGQVVAEGPVTAVVGYAHRKEKKRNVCRIQVPLSAITQAREALEGMPTVLNVTQEGESAGWFSVTVVDKAEGVPSGQQLTNDLLETLIGARIPITGYEAGGGRLQDVFLQLTDEVTE